MNREEALQSFEKLLDVMDRLREECPWDREQTNESLRSLTIEETYELSEAILNGDSFNISKELGDLLLHVVFYAKIGEEKGEFDISIVIERLCEKLIFRHPHVFAKTEVAGAGDVVKNWEQLKGKEKDGNRSVLSGVPVSMPSLVKAYRIQDKARAVGFDWEKREQVWDKVKEELAEFEQELKKQELKKQELKEESLVKYQAEQQAERLAEHLAEQIVEQSVAAKAVEQEFGDLLFSLVNVARLYEIDPDSALEMTNKKFIKRFNYLEKQVKESGKSLKDLTLQQMDSLWNQAKRELE